MFPLKHSKYVVPLILAVLLAGCGGEETEVESDSSSDDTLPYTTSEVLLASFLDSLDTVRTEANRLLNDDARYQLQEAPSGYYVDGVALNGSPLKHAGVHYAHAAGLTGAGEIIAISDGGFLTSHETLDGKTLTTGSGIAEDDHGTFVASVAAGNSDDMIGVAPGADLILGSYNSFAQLSATARTATTMGAVALNNSWGYVGWSATTADYNDMLSYSGAQNYVDALKTYAQDGIILFALSNDSTVRAVDLLPDCQC